MKTIYIYIIFLSVFFFQNSYSQSVKIIDKNTSEPIPGTLIMDTLKTVFIISDKNGIADLKPFLKLNKVIIHNNYYKNITISLDSIKQLKYIIKLEKTTFELGSFIITANKWEQNSNEIPFSITTIDPKKIRLTNPQTAADMLGYTGKIFIQKSQLGGGSPMIRGFSANSVLLVVDGVRMNNAIFRGGNLQNSLNIDPNSLGQVEVIFGPGSVTYGSDALGGVMDFHTKEANFSMNKPFSTTIEAMYRTSSATSEQTLSLGVDLKWQKFSSHTQFLRSNFSNLRAGKNHFGNYPEFGKRKYVAGQTQSKKDTMIPVEDDHIMFPSYFSLLNINQKFRYKPNNNYDITYSFIYSNTSDIPRYDRLIEMNGNNLKYADWYYGPQKWIMHNLRFRFFKQTKIYDTGKIIFAYQFFQESRNDRKFGSPIFRQRTENVDLITANLDFNKKLKNNSSLYYGIDLNFNNVNSKALSEDLSSGETASIQTRYPNKLNHYYTAGIFFNYKKEITKKLNLMAGFRYSFTGMNSKFDTSYNQLPYSDINLYNSAPNGSLGLAYMANNSTQINFNLASGFRAPNIDDIAKVFDSEPGSVVVPNSNLKPEYSYSGEISLTKSFNKIIKIELSAYSSFVNNIIVRKDFTYNGQEYIIYDDTLSKVQAMQNVDNAIIYGSSFAAFVNISKSFTLTTTHNFSKGIDSDNNNLRHIPPYFGNTRLTYKRKTITANLYTNYSGKIKFENLAPSEQKKTHIYSPDGSTAWYTINISSSIKIYKTIHLDLAIENILDRFYIPYSSGIAAPGINFMIGIRVLPF